MEALSFPCLEASRSTMEKVREGAFNRPVLMEALPLVSPAVPSPFRLPQLFTRVME